MNSRSEQVIQLISKVHSMYLGPKVFGVHKAQFLEFKVETNRKRFEARSCLGIWPVKLFLGVTSVCSLQEIHPVLRCNHLPVCS